MRIAKAVGMAIFAVAAVVATPAEAHCDGLDGPVVTAARQALEANDPDRVLIWVQPAAEAETRAAFQHAIAVRRLGPDARELADRFFFETVVRLHRAGEGAPYTGLQPAGRDLGQAITLADRAVATGSVGELSQVVAGEVTQGIQARFEDLQSKRQFDRTDLAAGRDYISSYVSFIHYVEAIDVAARSLAEGHYAEGAAIAETGPGTPAPHEDQ